MGSKRIGVLTGGGDCPGLNAVIRAVTKDAIRRGYEVIGVEDGGEGLFEQRYQQLTIESVRGLLMRGGTILGSSNRADPFKYPVRQPDGSEVVEDVSEQVLKNLAALDLEALVAIGGDGTMRMCANLIQRGAKIVGVPKTIDNDLPATDQTFGYDTAVMVATEAIDRLHTTAESHDRIVLCEVMGRYAGWIAMGAGLAGGADVILIPEIPYKIDRIVEAIKKRKKLGISFSIIVVAEGAYPIGGELAVAKAADGAREKRLGGAAHRLEDELSEHFSEHELRTTVLGHVQRGGTPTAFDRLLGTRFGVEAVNLVVNGKLGEMVCLRGTEIKSVPISQASKKSKFVDPNGQLANAARDTGVELGG